MNSNSAIIATAITGLLALGASGVASAEAKMEKCYGIVKAGKNDCQTNTSACAGTSTKDGQKDAWIYLPKGSCDKIVGGSTKKG
ncbi:MAG: DUF2282 domain-containing protein [Pseudomonadota bacterium]|nr:MAG: DUF2282 domain-containing protein [Pseudomonadota bacterium]